VRLPHVLSDRALQGLVAGQFKQGLMKRQIRPEHAWWAAGQDCLVVLLLNPNQTGQRSFRNRQRNESRRFGFEQRAHGIQFAVSINDNPGHA